MKKLLSLALACVIGLTTLVGCGGSNKTKIIVGTMAEPGEPILEAIREDFEAKGYELELQIFNSFDLVNPPLANGSIHANLFQHEPYLNTYNKDNNQNLVVAKKLYLPVYGIYSKKFNSLESIPNGAQIAVPADSSNLSRSLKILASYNLITLADKEIVGVEDITSNPKNFDIKTVESSLIAGTLNDDNSLGVVNATFAIAANLATSATLLGTEQLADKLTNANILAVRAEDQNEQWVKDLVDSLTSATCYDFITEHYNGIIDPSFTRPAQ